MFDFPKTNDFAFAVNKTKDVAVSTVDFGNTLFNESLKFFNEITGKTFYTYTVKAAEAHTQVTDYAKEFIKTGTIKEIFANSGKN
jgi:hypothetical protein